MKWKVVSTQFGKLELALNRLSDEGFGIWKLVILSPESTRTKRFVVIVIGRKSGQEIPENEAGCQALAKAPAPINGVIEAAEPAIVTIFGDNQNDRDLKNGKRAVLDRNLSDKPWRGKLVDPEFRPDRKTGRFDVKEPSN
jgi:hypothetical protein